VEQIYTLGIDELDAQHEAIEAVLDALQDALRNKERWHVLHYVLESLHEKLRFHFACEEVVMQVFAYPEAAGHRQSHQEMLALVGAYRNRNLNSSELDDRGKPPAQLFHEQIVSHDMKLAAYLKGLRARLGLQ
jgi:hemerythrin-like metal-binding protein